MDIANLQNKFFVELKRRGRVANTLKNYRTDLNCFNLYLAEKKRGFSSDFDIPEIEEYWHFLDRRYGSDNSKRRRLQALRIFFDYLIGQGLLPSNPVRKLLPPPKFLDKPNPPPPESVQALWEHLLVEPGSGSAIDRLIALRNQILFLCIYTAALKVSDLSQLTRDQIFLDQDPRILVTPPKRDPYSIPLSDVFGSVFRKYEALLGRAKEQSRLSFREVFFNANPFRILSGGISPRGIELVFKGLRHELDIEGLTARSLRQACILRWIGCGHHEGLIREWIGVAPSYSLKPYRECPGGGEYEDVSLR